MIDIEKLFVCQMTELAKSQIAGALGVLPVPPMDQQEELQDSRRNQQQDKAESDRYTNTFSEL